VSGRHDADGSVRNAGRGHLYAAIVKVRLSLLVEESDFFEIGRAARLRGQSVTAWVRQAVRAELESERVVAAKIEAIRRAVKYSAPTADIEQMLAEIGSS
jgi:plasmid stability protein